MIGETKSRIHFTERGPHSVQSVHVLTVVNAHIKPFVNQSLVSKISTFMLIIF